MEATVKFFLILFLSRKRMRRSGWSLLSAGRIREKREYAKRRFSLEEDRIFTCREDGEIDFSSRCIDRIEEFALWCVRSGADPSEIFRENRDQWRDSVLICTDIFCGVVPLEAEARAWREATARLCAYLSGEAAGVTRMFCGLAQKLK